MRGGVIVGIVGVILLAGCGKDNGSTPRTSVTSPLPPGSNVLAVSVGKSGVCNVVNQVCATVTICEPGTSNCRSVTDLLVDTGSYGIRMFRSALPASVPLSQITNAQGQIGECGFFVDGTAFWGAVQIADVRLGNEPAVSVPIQVIDSTFAGQSASTNPCQASVESSPAGAHFNGILGIGLFQHDCGTACVISASNGLYFACSGSTCNGTNVSLFNQVQNPIPLLPVDNNGVILQLPAVPADGAGSATGALIFGIGTALNNDPSPSVNVYTADLSGNFTITLDGTSYPESFIDSGSNAFFFPSTLPACSGSLQAFYCPPSTTSFSATVTGRNGTQGAVGFQIANAQSLVDTRNGVFDNLGGSVGNSNFDWGLPFFLGRTVYIGIEGQTSSSLGTGPYWAF